MRQSALPKHVAIIMDGNGRWAKKRCLPRLAGHRAGLEAARGVIRRAAELGLQALTLFSFSSENWRRPADEVSGILSLFSQALTKRVAELHQHQIKVCVIGNLDQFKPGLREQIEKAQSLTANNTGLQLNIAANYGGRWDIVNAAQRVAHAVAEGRLQPNEIDEASFASMLSTQGIPDPDLFIRTSGEQRISNFLLWQLSYTELYFTEKFWPEFSADEFDKALSHFEQRQRRYGYTDEQLSQQGEPCA